MVGGSRGRSPSTEVRLLREIGAESGDFWDGEGFIDGGGNVRL